MKKRIFTILAIAIPLLVSRTNGKETPSTSTSESSSESSSIATEKISMDEINKKFYGPIAHRGLHHGGSNTYPDNSLSAFKMAGISGYAIENDVHLTKDNKLVIVHDSTISNVGRVESSTLEEIRKGYKLSDGSNIPTFEEAYNVCKEYDTPILMELKSPDDPDEAEKLGEAVLAEARRLKISGANIIFCSFTWLSIIPLLNSEYNAGLFISNGTNKELVDSVLGAEEEIANAPDFVACDEPVSKGSKCIAYRAKGHKVFSWTIKTQDTYESILPYSDGQIFENFIPKKSS